MATKQTNRITKKTAKSKPVNPDQGSDEVATRLDAQIEQDKREKAEAAGVEYDPRIDNFWSIVDEIESQGVECCLMALPLADPPSNESQYTKVEVNLRASEKQAFMRLRAGLRQSGAKLADGRPVWSSADVVRWLTLQIVQVNE